MSGRDKFGGLPPRRPDQWTDKRRAWQIRQLRDEAQEGIASQALTDHQAALAVFQLFEQASNGRLDLSEIEATELDALGSMIETELQDRGRRESSADFVTGQSQVGQSPR